jgi:hypothetical protein
MLEPAVKFVYHSFLNSKKSSVAHAQTAKMKYGASISLLHACIVYEIQKRYLFLFLSE